MPFARWFARSILLVLYLWTRVRRTLLFWWKEKADEKFSEFYQPAGWFSPEETDRLLSGQFEHCVSCSRCTLQCQAVQKGVAPPGFEPKQLLQGAARSPHESEVFLEEWVPCVACEACTTDCPVGIPVHRAAELLIERRQRIRYRQPDVRSLDYLTS